MALDTGMKCIKYLLFIFNLVFVICGVALIIVGAFIEVFYRSYLNFLTTSSYLSAPTVLIVVGVFIFVVGFFGCCGAIKENRCMVVTYTVLLCLIFIVQVGAAIGAYILRSDVEDFLKHNLQNSMQNYDEKHQGVEKTWNVMQHDYMCCGTNNYTDWMATEYGDRVNGVPDDCCKEATRDCGNDIFNNPKPREIIYTDGCFDKLKGDVKENMTILGGVAIGIGFVELVGIVFATCLSQSLKRQYETV